MFSNNFLVVGFFPPHYKKDFHLSLKKLGSLKYGQQPIIGSFTLHLLQTTIETNATYICGKPNYTLELLQWSTSNNRLLMPVRRRVIELLIPRSIRTYAPTLVSIMNTDV